MVANIKTGAFDSSNISRKTQMIPFIATYITEVILINTCVIRWGDFPHFCC